jgi:predicted small lipoprotein YifL
MSHLKRLILISFFSQIVACGQKGALVITEKSSPDKTVPLTKQLPAEKPLPDKQEKPE